ncbi:MAG: dTMP kinase [Vulcanimicrobiaceae bacterium]
MTTREPGGTALGNRLRAVFVEPDVSMTPLAEAYVVNASRAQLMAEIVEPALARGAWVLCDRFSDATYAYQGFGRGLGYDTLRALVDGATGGRIPNLTLLVDVPVEVSRSRVAARAAAAHVAIDRLEREDVAFHERVRAGYLALARDDERIATLDGTRPPEEVAKVASAIVYARFALPT